jgi:hypothetical protein
MVQTLGLSSSSNRRSADIGILTVIPPELAWTRKALEIRDDSRQKNEPGAFTLLVK